MAKNSPSGHHRTTLSGCILKARIDNRKKNLLNSNTSSTCPHNMANFGSLTAEIDSAVWGHPRKFQRVSRVGFVTAATSLSGGQPDCMIFGHLLVGYTIYTFSVALSLDGILTGAEFTLRPSFTFSYIGSVTARHSSSGCQPNFAALRRERHLYSAGRPSCWASAHILVFKII